MKIDPVTLANEQVSILLVCRMVGVELADTDVGRSRKVDCPFGYLYHSDGGVSAAMRIYPDTNSAYCFSCSAYFTPVGLLSQALGIDRRRAAAKLLDHTGLLAFDAATAWAQAQETELAPDKALLADALKTYCRRIEPAWSSRQFDTAVASTLARCLALLELVGTGQDVTQWLQRCKEVMHRTLIREEPSLRQKYELLWGDLTQGKEGQAS